MNRLMTTLLMVAGVTCMAGEACANPIKEPGVDDVGVANTLDIQQPDSTTTATHLQQAPSTRVIAYYFHGEFRCENCLRIEAWTESTIRQEFAKELGDSLLLWSAVNIDETENEHFIDDFKLSNRSVILVELVDGAKKRWKNLEAVWDLIDNEQAFRQYIRDETESYLTGEGDRSHAPH